MSAVVRAIRTIESINERVGRVTAWLILGVVIVCFGVAVLRYVFSMGWVWLQESYVWMHAIVFMVASGYTLLHDEHVRIDVLYGNRGYRYKAWVNLLGTLIFLFPMLAVVLWFGVPYVVGSWEKLERSREAGGLAGLYLLKSTMIVFGILLALEGAAMILRSILTLRGHPEFQGRERREEAL